MKKIPYQINGKCLSSAERTHFSSFDAVMEKVSEYDGIGVGVFDGFCAIDIDHCHNNGVLSDTAKDIIAAMNSYTEFSPPGDGVHIYFKVNSLAYDKARYYVNNHKLGLEIYVSGHTNKFMTVTGDDVNDLGIEERSDELLITLEKYMVRPQIGRTADRYIPGSVLSDDSVITKAMSSQQGEKFNAL